MPRKKKKAEDPPEKLISNPAYQDYMMKYRRKLRRLKYEASEAFLEEPPPSED